MRSGFLASLTLSLCCALTSADVAAGAGAAHDALERAPVFPRAHWKNRTAAALDLDGSVLDAFVAKVGGSGIIVRHGYIVRSWGVVDERLDWASALKSLLGTLLFLAIDEGTLSGVHQTIAADWPDLKVPDRRITFHHLANNISGYAMPDRPGKAWSYNDNGIRLLCESLRKVYGGRTVAQAIRKRLRRLKLEDGLSGARERCGVLISVRDFARVGWLWLNRGIWRKRQVIADGHFSDSVRVQVPGPMAVARATACNDYLGVGTFGGECSQTPFGPGIFGYTWWFNGIVGGSQRRAWPAAPVDTYVADGDWDARIVVVIPSLDMVAVTQQQNDNVAPDLGRMNGKLELLAKAVLD
ncbi:MAG TPA: serine hydrolase [Acidobacteriota bacterium]|nr:serine hydrolase [Acidobacteriota bacterium]